MSALEQAAAGTAKLLGVAVAVLAAAWLVSGVRTVEPGQRVVVLRLGAPVAVHGPGLVVTAPRPIDRVVAVPAADALQVLEVADLDAVPPAEGVAASDALPLRGAGGYALSGEAGVVHAKATLRWTIEDPVAYVRAGNDPAAVEPTLRACVKAAITLAAARRALDALVVFGDGDAQAAASRERLRDEIAADLRRRVQPLGLGVGIARLDLALVLPATAKPAFEQVAGSRQQADKDISEARTAAERGRQQAGQESDRIRAAAHAAARELVSQATVATATVSALASADPSMRGVLAQRLWRERVESALKRVRSVTAVAPDGGTVLVPGWSR